MHYEKKFNVIRDTHQLVPEFAINHLIFQVDSVSIEEGK